MSLRGAAVAIACLALVACAEVPTPPPEIRTQTVTVQVPVPVPCFTEADRPKLPEPTRIDPETATTEQLAAAELADAIALQRYTDAVDRLFIACQQSKGTQP
jgi:hypothetical protein